MNSQLYAWTPCIIGQSITGNVFHHRTVVLHYQKNIILVLRILSSIGIFCDVFYASLCTVINYLKIFQPILNSDLLWVVFPTADRLCQQVGSDGKWPEKEVRARTNKVLKVGVVSKLFGQIWLINFHFWQLSSHDLFCNASLHSDWEILISETKDHYLLSQHSGVPEQAIYHSLSHTIKEVARGMEVSILKKIGVILQVK